MTALQVGVTWKSLVEIYLSTSSVRGMEALAIISKQPNGKAFSPVNEVKNV